MLGNQRGFDRKECAGPNVKANRLPFHSFGIQRLQDGLSKMQTGRRSRYRAPYAGVKRLIALLVHRFGFAVQIRRDGHCSGHFQNARERITALPAESDSAGFPVPSFQYSP